MKIGRPFKILIAVWLNKESLVSDSSAYGAGFLTKCMQ